MVRTKNAHTSGTFFENFRKNVQKHFQLMFPYKVKYTEFEYDIQNNGLLYKIDHKCQNTFDFLVFLWDFSKIFKNIKLLFYYSYNFHNSYFVIFVNYCFFGFLYFYIYIYVERRTSLYSR